jgi:hypothetical protein
VPTWSSRAPEVDVLGSGIRARQPARKVRWWARLDRWAEHRLEIEEILGVEGTATVIVRYRMTGRSHSGVPIDAPWIPVFDFDRGEIVRARNFGSFDTAIESVGPTKLSRLWERARD